MASPSGVAVTDASCVIGLHAIGRLGLLCQIYDVVIVPVAVLRDLEATAGSPEAAALSTLPCVQIRAPRRAVDLPPALHPGEREAIALGLEVGALHVLLDELAGRRAAADRGIRVAGTLRVILRAKEMGLIVAVRPEIEALQRSGFYLAARLIARVLATAGESAAPE